MNRTELQGAGKGLGDVRREKDIFVVGATGQQGGAETPHLLGRGFSVRAFTRDPGSEKAAPLRASGVEFVQGDLTDRAGLDEALRGVDGVFSVATAFEAGLEAEVAQGTTLGDAAVAAGVTHYVYSSVGGADRDSGVPHFESKWRIENHLRGLGPSVTIVRPVYFFEDFGGWSMQPSGDGYTLAMPLSRERTLQAPASDDIGAFVALAFAAPEDWRGREVELAGDERTAPEYARAISQRLGVPVDYVQVPWDAIRSQSEDLYRMYDFFERHGHQADIAALRRDCAGLHTFDAWFEEGALDRLRASG